MKITVITPVHKLDYLFIIAKTIPSEANWICVYDGTIPSELHKFATCLYMKPIESNWGVAKVNFALDCVKDGYVYILDDDTVLHKDFHILMSLSSKFDFIHFNQEYKGGIKRTGGIVKRFHIDIGNFIVSRDLIGDTFLKEDTRTPDGIWAEELYEKSKNPLYLNKTFSTYNALR